jgi:hypothetical protein
MFFLAVSGTKARGSVGRTTSASPGAPNKALQPMPYSVRSFLASAFGHG